MIKYQIVYSLLVFTAFFSIHQNCLAKNLTFLSPVDFSPWVIIENGKTSGVIFDWASTIAKDTQSELNFRSVPYARFIKSFSTEKDFDMTVVDDVFSFDTSAFIKIEPPLKKYPLKMMFSKKMKCSEFKRIASLNTNLRDSEKSSSKNCKYEAEMIPAKDLNQRLDLLFKNRVDAIILSEPEIEGLPLEMQSKIKSYQFKILRYIESHFYVRKSSILNTPANIKKISAFSKALLLKK